MCPGFEDGFQRGVEEGDLGPNPTRQDVIHGGASDGISGTKCAFHVVFERWQVWAPMGVPVRARLWTLWGNFLL